MNITPAATLLPLATVVNQPTENLRRENNQREIITQVVATNASAAEKAVASEKERARTPAQTNEQVDFANLRKQAEQDASAVSERRENQNNQQQEQQSPQQQRDNASQQAAKEKTIEDEQNASEQDRIDKKVINQLSKRDREVRSHELAHATVGGSTTGSPSYSFEVGPNGKKYAVDGEVKVDLSIVAGDPKATILKMQKVYDAALAPINPSPQDIRVAASATRKILTAQSELLTQQKENSTQATDNENLPIDDNEPQIKAYQNQSSDDFDTLINQTLSAQEVVSNNFDATNINNQIEEINSNQLSQSAEVKERAKRIESFYFVVSQGYEKPATFQFELTA